jgi:hypothetical protein
VNEQEFAAIGVIGDNNLVWCDVTILGTVLSPRMLSVEWASRCRRADANDIFRLTDKGPQASLARMFETAETEAEVADAPASASSVSEPSGIDARVARYAEALGPLTPPERLRFLREALDGRMVFTHGFGIEGQVILHWICEQELDIDLVTLDTGRLFPETY